MSLMHHWSKLLTALALTSACAATACGSILGVDFGDAEPRDGVGAPGTDANGAAPGPEGVTPAGDGPISEATCAAPTAGCPEGGCPRAAGDIVSIGASGSYTCAVYRDGTAKCWVLGSQPPFTLAQEGVTLARMIPSYLMFISTDGALYATESVESGSLTRKLSKSPTDERMVGYAIGTSHGCILTPECTVKCMGSNTHGQLGDGTDLDRASFVEVKGIDKLVTDVIANDDTSCARLADGTVKCWGSRWESGANAIQKVPEDYVALSSSSVVAVTGNRGGYVCAARSDGLLCQGGFSGISGRMIRPRMLDDSEVSVRSLTLADQHGVAVTTSGKLLSFGTEKDGKMATGQPTKVGSWQAYTESPLPSGDVVVQAAAGDAHTCALLASGQVKCWGRSYSDGGTETVGPTVIDGL